MSTAEAWTVGRLLTWTADYLKKHGSTSPRLDAEVLLAEARGCQRIELYTAFSEEPPEAVRASFKEMVRRRAEGTPVAYLVGRKEFYSLPFEINPDVLVPRPETEHLVVEAIDRAKKLTGQPAGRSFATSPVDSSVAESLPRESIPAESLPTDSSRADTPAGELQASNDASSVAAVAEGAGQGSARARAAMSYAGLTIADVGTGSGIVAICLAKSLPGAHVVALDISPAALALAARNIQQHAVGEQVRLVKSDLLSAIPEDHFDLIVSNPPYITEAEYAELPISVRNFEPRGALVGGADGTEIIRRLLTQAGRQLRSGGWLLLEISPTIADRVIALIDRSQWSEPTITKDLSGHARVVSTSRL